VVQAATKPGTIGASYQPRYPALRWIEKRLPIGELGHAEFVG
jgi:hypothetical protein